MNVMEPRAVMFQKYASGHRMSFFGPISQRLIDIAHQHADESHMYLQFQTLEQPAVV
jgi:hypothetical protein